MLHSSTSTSTSTRGKLTFIPPPPPSPSPNAAPSLDLTRSLLLTKLARPSTRTSSTSTSSTSTFTRLDLTTLVQSFLLSAPPSTSEAATPHRWFRPFILTFLFVSRSIRSLQLNEDEPGRLFLECLPRELRRAVEARCGCGRGRRVKVPSVLMGKGARLVEEVEEEEREMPLPTLETLLEVAFELLREARERPAAPHRPHPTPPPSPTSVPLGAGHSFVALRALYGRPVADRWSRQFDEAVGFDPNEPLGAPGTVQPGTGKRRLEGA